ncbi:TPA: ATP-binding protein [Enterobacter chuandaensis]|uniref:ATP-binding protein n=1 Tax=Enterobacter nematophilus TaxID=2994648 RepID=UPI0032F8D6B9|nr:ATP-binding protein [Enterobacter chuandaensis]
MNKTIEKLIASGKEGSWWDFKQTYHQNNACLVHDILCMANVLHDGDRYLIFGVTDEGVITGVPENGKQLNQANLIDLLRKVDFAEHRCPDIQLHHITLHLKTVAILQIRNVRMKPYYLTKDYSKEGKTIRAGVVYNRQQDANTPVNGCASPGDVMAMWRERFNLDLAPADRIVRLLLDYDNWEYDGISEAYYRLDPDFAINIGDTEKGIGGQYWWSAISFEQPYRCEYILKYRGRVLQRVPIVHYSNEGLQFPFPEIDTLSYPDKRDGFMTDYYADVFYFVKNTLKYNLLSHIRAVESLPGCNSDITMPLTTQTKPPIIRLPFMVFDNVGEKEEKLKFIQNQLADFCPDSISDTAALKNEPESRMEVEKQFSWWVFKNIG